MWPWGHLGVGYLAYAALREDAPADVPTLALAVGAGFPDLVDKPLALAGALPAGRSLAHSLPVAAVVLAVVVGILRRRDPVAGVAFAVGYLTHIGADAIGPVIFGELPSLGFLLWPVTPLAPTPLVPVDPATRRLWIGYLVAQAGIAAVALRAWRADGMPGLRIAREAVGR